MEDDFQPKLTDYLERYPNNIKYGGYFDSKKELCSFYSRAKLIAIPSLSESFCFVAVEAGFFSTVMVGSKITALLEISDNGQCAFLENLESEQKYTEILEYAFCHPEEVEEKSLLIKERITEYYDWTKICQNLINYIH